MSWGCWGRAKMALSTNRWSITGTHIGPQQLFTRVNKSTSCFSFLIIFSSWVTPPVWHNTCATPFSCFPKTCRNFLIKQQSSSGAVSSCFCLRFDFNTRVRCFFPDLCNVTALHFGNVWSDDWYHCLRLTQNTLTLSLQTLKSIIPLVSLFCFCLPPYFRRWVIPW